MEINTYSIDATNYLLKFINDPSLKVNSEYRESLKKLAKKLNIEPSQEKFSEEKFNELFSKIKN